MAAVSRCGSVFVLRGLTMSVKSCGRHGVFTPSPKLHTPSRTGVHLAVSHQHFRWLNPPGQEQDDYDDDNETGTSTQIVVASAESITSASQKQDDK